MLEVLVREARVLVAGLDVDRLSGAEAREHVEGFAELERLAHAGKLLATGRLVESGAGPGDDSFRDTDTWLASVSGTTIGAARATTKAATRIVAQPTVAAAVRSGALSGPQAELVASAAAADEASAERLVALAQHAGAKGLRTECHRVIAAAMPPDVERATAEYVYAQRSLRHTTRADGSATITMTGPTDRTAMVMAALEPFERAIFTDNRRSGAHEHPDAVAFDAMVEATRTGAAHGPDATRSGRPLATIVVHVSQEAFARGSTRPGERCEIEGAGPIPVSSAHRLSSDAIVKALVTDGIDITRVVSLGRSVPAALATGLGVRDPVCVIEGCEVDRHLEIDHNVPYAQGGPTSYENNDRVCGHHHALKTRHDLRRLGPRGRQRLVTRAEYDTAINNTAKPRDG